MRLTNENSSFYVGIALGITLCLVIGVSIFRITGWDEALSLSKKAQSELQSGLRGVEQALGISQNSIESIDDLVRIAGEIRKRSRESAAREDSLRNSLAASRKSTAIAEEANRNAEESSRQIREIFESGQLDLDRLIEWAEGQNL